MTTTTNVGDPLGHPGFVRGEEEEEEPAVGEGCYVLDSEDDDDDVDRYVFLARKPAPAEASDDDEDDGAMPTGGGGGGGEGGCGRKRHLSEILAHAPPAAKKARRIGLVAAPRGASAEESGSVRSAERGGLDLGKKNMKRRRCGGEPQAQSAARGKRSSGADPEVSQGSQHWHVMAAEAAAGGAPRRFPCSICGRCFGSYQALGGHVHLGHTKKAKPAIAAASHGDVTGNGCRDEKVAMADGAGHGKEKIAVVASPEESDGDGKNTLRAAARRQDVDSISGDSNSNEDMFIYAANHRGDGNVEGESHDDADGNGDGTEGKAAVGRCHELAATGNGNSAVRKTQYRCGVCGKEYPSGKALGGHMRKHRKLSPHDGGKERRSLEVADGAGRGQEKAAVAATPGEFDGDGKKTIDATACHQDDVDSSSGDSNEEEMFIGAEKHGDAHGTERKVAVGRCKELAATAIGNVNSIARKTQYRCEVCGKECPSGQALGGHMRKHRKRSPEDGGGKERTSPEVISQPKNPQYGNRFDGGMVGWL